MLPGGQQDDLLPRVVVQDPGQQVVLEHRLGVRVHRDLLVLLSQDHHRVEQGLARPSDL